MSLSVYGVYLIVLGKYKGENQEFREEFKTVAYSKREAIQNVIARCKEQGIRVLRVDTVYENIDPCSQNPLYFGSAGHYH